MFIEGKNSVIEALNVRKKISKIYILNTNSTKDIIKKASELGIKYEVVTKQMLDKMSKTSNHDGVIAEVEDYKYCTLDENIKLENLEKTKDAQEEQLNEMILVYFGKNIFTNFVRMHLEAKSKLDSVALSRMINKFASAEIQAKMWNILKEELNEKELDIGRRARNIKFDFVKNAKLEDYRDAASLKSVIGYNYLTGNIDRVIQLMKCINIVTNTDFI